MKILFILSEYLPESGGGIISYYGGMLSRIVEEGHSVDVLVVSAGTVGQPGISINGVHVSYLDEKYLARYQVGFERYMIGFPTFAAFLPLAWAAYEQTGHGGGYDLVETTDFPMLFAPWVVSTDSPPTVVSLHGSCGQLDWYEYPDRNSMDGDLLRFVERTAFSCAPGVYANSQANACFWEASTRRAIPLLQPAQLGKNDIPYRITECSIHGVVVGRFQKWKGSRVICEALKQLPGEGIRWIGRDVIDAFTGIPHSASLKKEFPDILDNQLVFEGSMSRQDIFREIAAAPYLCVPSEWDVFNITVVEAMNLGTPVICSIRAGASMLIENHRNGFLFNPEKPEELAACIRTVLGLSSEGRENIVRNAMQTIKIQLDPDRLIAKRMAFYQDVIVSYSGWKTDEWLKDALSPREESENRAERLRSYTTKELVKASGAQAMDGILRHLGVGHKSLP